MVVREMKILVYFVALTSLLCLGAKADSKKIVWMSNKGKADVVIRCTSGVTVFNKFLKAEEKARWKLPAKTHTGICHVDIKGKGKGGGQGYLSVFVERECKSECRWRVFDDGIVKLRLASGVWKSFPLVSDEESARRSCEDESAAPQRHMVENEFDAKSLAPAPSPYVKSPPPKNRENAPPPLPRHVKSPPPRNKEHTHGAPSPLPEHVKSEEHPGHEPSRAPSPIKQRPRDIQSPSPEPTHWAPPPWDGDEETPQPDKGEVPPLPQPGSTFYTCIKEGTD